MIFHWYGFILGCAIVLGSYFLSRAAKKFLFHEKLLDTLVFTTVVSGIVGARIWHVVTDFYLYQDHYLSALYIWNGGMSIIGGFFGGALGIVALMKLKKVSQKNIMAFLDLIPFGLPFAQAVGRFGNYVNHELYGLPTNLPWKLYIPPQNRLAGFADVSYYHPLFAYEACLMVLFGIWLWWQQGKKNSTHSVGSASVLAQYLLYYSVVRFALDFLRIDTAVKIGGILGVNQIVLLICIVGSTLFLSKQLHTRKTS
jgi:phosphatidylglycerol:prolipoprotein diacylglycerol transferase